MKKVAIFFSILFVIMVSLFIGVVYKNIVDIKVDDIEEFQITEPANTTTITTTTTETTKTDTTTNSTTTFTTTTTVITTTTKTTTLVKTTVSTQAETVLFESYEEIENYFNEQVNDSVESREPVVNVPQNTTTLTTPAPIITTVSGTQISLQSIITTENRYQIGQFKGTYYTPVGSQRAGNTKGGSGRTLIDCSCGDSNGIKGSVACKAIYEEYGYNLNGRTIIYVESASRPELNGYYYVDDCCASRSVIDFYYDSAANCPFQYQGVVRDIIISITP